MKLCSNLLQGHEFLWVFYVVYFMYSWKKRGTLTSHVNKARSAKATTFNSKAKVPELFGHEDSKVTCLSIYIQVMQEIFYRFNLLNSSNLLDCDDSVNVKKLRSYTYNEYQLLPLRKMAQTKLLSVNIHKCILLADWH